jgi:secondary thiamine-phosphate synthase enzyme
LRCIVSEILDTTDRIERHLPRESGICFLNILHTTAALATADLDSGTDLDMLDTFEAMIPRLRYRHPHNPEHVPDNILSALIGTGLTLPVKADSLAPGAWQRVILVELDGPRQREWMLQWMKTSRS